MDQCKLWLVLLLPVGLCLASEVTLVKTVGKEPDVTTICTTEALSSFTVVCTISDRSKGKQCHLLYRNDVGFVDECDHRFRLMKDNQTIFLLLTGLTPVDSGNYTCRCSRSEGTHTLHLNITVEGSYEEQPSGSSSGLMAFVGILVAVFIIVPGVVVGRILRKKYLSYDTTSEAPALSVCEAPCSLDQYHPDDSYKHLEYPASDIYQNISMQYEEDDKRNSADSYISTADWEQDIDEETDQNCDIYENL